MKLSKDIIQLVYFISIVVILLFIWGMFSKTGYTRRRYHRSGIVFTCSTFFDFRTGDRWERFCKAIDSIQEHHSKETLLKIRKWIVINEYSAESKDNWQKKIKERYPWIEFYQKGVTEKGQARTMNIILREKIRDADLWIHWEEAWEVRAPFLEDAIMAMEGNDDAPTQLQFTFHNGTVNWMDIDKSRIHCDGRVCRIDAADDTKEWVKNHPKDMTKETFASWPLYSLLPSINKASHFEDLGEFSEDPKLWPIRFEWDFARRWWLAGGTKAVLNDGPVWRPGTHISTYATNT